MSRGGTISRCVGAGFSRVSGDEPWEHTNYAAQLMFSPRE